MLQLQDGTQVLKANLQQMKLLRSAQQVPSPALTHTSGEQDAHVGISKVGSKAQHSLQDFIVTTAALPSGTGWDFIRNQQSERAATGLESGHKPICSCRSCANDCRGCLPQVCMVSRVVQVSVCHVSGLSDALARRGKSSSLPIHFFLRTLQQW